MTVRSFDTIVVGGGSAGCILAAELSADPAHHVLLLEHGEPAEANPETLSADGYKDAFVNDRLLFERFSTEDARWGDRRIFLGTGRGLGGSGSINGMVYTRGHRADFDAWPHGWRWDDLTPDFEALEQRLRIHRREPTEFTEACIAAAEARGFRRSEDLNDGDLAGVLGYEWMSYDGDERRSSYAAFLKPALGRPNLEVITGAAVRRVLFRGRRATGVEWLRGGERVRASATGEVVLTAGALESPRLLLLSGVGPGEALRRVGVPVVHDLPGVGQNLHDHPNVSVFFQAKEEVDFNYPQLYGFHRANHASALPAGQPDSCYVFYPARSSFREGLIRLLPNIALPPAVYGMPGARAGVRGAIDVLFRARAVRDFVARMYGVVVILGKPESRGSLTLESNDASRPARIDPGYFKSATDMETMIHGVRLARQIASAEPLKQRGNRELLPGPLARDSAGIQRFIEKNVMTTFHFAGSCRMGTGEGAVVDGRLRVRGLEGLRVADASVMPETPVSALNAPSMMIGLRAARLIAEDARHAGADANRAEAR